MSKFSSEEQLVIMLYSPGNRQGLTAELIEMKNQLTPGERKLRHLADSILEKLDTMTDQEFERFDFFP